MEIWKLGLINYCCKVFWHCANSWVHCSNGVTTAEGRKLRPSLKADSTVGKMVGCGCVLAGLFLKTSKQTQINKWQPLTKKQTKPSLLLLPSCPTFPKKPIQNSKTNYCSLRVQWSQGVSLWIFRCVFSELSAKEKQHVCGLGGAFDGNTLDGECLITFHFKLSLL